MDSQFVSPADFHSGLLALGFNVTQEEADVLANVLETDEAGNINLASLQQEGSPLVEQLAALAGAAPEAGPPEEEEEEEAAPSAEPQPTDAALAAIDALERGDEAAFADALGRMPPAEAEALQQALALQQDPPTEASYDQEQPAEAAAIAPPPSAIPRAKPPKPQRSVSPPKRSVTYGKLADTFPVTHPAAESSASRDYSATLSSLQPRSKSPSKIPRRASASSREASPSGSASRSPLASRDVSPPPSRQSVQSIDRRLSRDGSARPSLSPSRDGSPLSRRSALERSCVLEKSPGESEVGSHFSTDDLAAMPADAQPLIALLLLHRVRVIDIFRQMDGDEDGIITPREFAKGVRSLGHDVPMAQISALFSQMDMDGDGTLDYNELHRMLRVGKAAENSRNIRRSFSGYTGHLPPKEPKREASPRVPPRLASTMARRLSVSDKLEHRNGAGETPAEAAVEEELWPQGLRQMLLRERMRVLDVFRHWEGTVDAEEEGSISVEDFKAGLRVLGLEASRRDLKQLFSAMGVPQVDQLNAVGEAEVVTGPLPFRELRRQLRVVSQRGTSHYLRQAAQQGKQLEAESRRGDMLSGVGQLRIDQEQKQRDERDSQRDGGTPRDLQSAADEIADELATSLWMSESPGTPRRGGGRDLTLSHLSSVSSPSLASISGMGMGSRHDLTSYGQNERVVQLGAAATSAKKRALAAAEVAATVTRAGHDGLLASEMSVQQWARAHYSVLLPELRKWELHPNGEIGFEHFADSLQSLGYSTTGRWQELKQVWDSWAVQAGGGGGGAGSGLLHWQRVRALMSGGRMVKVQHKKHTTKQYFKQPSRAGEGFGNRSAPRFRDAAHSLLGPGKYQPELVQGGRADAQRGVKAGVATHSGKLLHTEQRFKEDKKSSAPAPGSYRPRYTLTESRHNI